ncbi:MAG: L,D-transpeptidase family protein [Sphingomonadales bacterium]
MTQRSATVSQRTANLLLGTVGALGLAGIVAAFAVPVAAPTSVPVEITAKAPAAAPKPAAPVSPVVKVPAPPTTYVIASFIPRPAAFNHGDWIWKDEGVPAGPMLVIVDVKTQLIHVFRSGREIGVAVMMYGADDSPTPLGVHPIRWKAAVHRSSIFGSSMPYTMNLTGDGVAIHGSNVRWGWGTNGCVGVPIAFAKLLFGQVNVGDKVIIVKGKTPQTGQSVPLV